MKLVAYRCVTCLGVALIDQHKLQVEASIICPYCRNRYTNSVKVKGEMLPVLKALVWPEDFDQSVRIAGRGNDLKGMAR